MIYDSEKRLYIVMAFIAGLALLALFISIFTMVQFGMCIQILGGAK